MQNRRAWTGFGLAGAMVIGGSVTASQRFVPGEIVVAPAPGRGPTLTRDLAEAGLVVIESDAVSGAVRVAVPAGTEDDATAAWSARPGVAYAERNGLGSGGLVPDDTYFDRQWHLRNTGQSGGTPGADVECVAAWDIVTGSSSVVIAVLDTGIDSDHPEFAGRIDPDGFDFVNEDDDPEADHPHGSWVSGCIAANADNDFAVTGVDWGCRILPVKVLDANNGGNTFDLAQAINYCATQDDVSIISMSLINYPGTQNIIAAIDTARAAGKIVIACAGNGGIGNADESWPGASPQTISIGATTRTDARASFSGTGAALDFVAPGADIVTVRHGSGSNQFSTVSGCSFATPIAAGIAGLLLARAEELGQQLDHDDIIELFRDGAEDEVGPPGEDGPGRDDYFGHGRLNALASVQAMLANDLCRNAVVIGDGSLTFSNENATEDGPELPETCNEGRGLLFRKDIWFAYVATCDGLATAEVCDSTFDTRLAVYEDGDCPGPFLACNDDACGEGGTRSHVSFPVAAGATYLVRVGARFAVGTGTLVLSCVEGQACPEDLDGSGVVDFGDIVVILAAWGPCEGCPEDLDGSGAADVGDVLAVLAVWGPCP